MRELRVTGGIGLAFLAVDLTAIVTGGPLPWLDASGADIATFYDDHATRLLVQAYVRGVAMALLVWFGVRLAVGLGGRDRRDLALVVAGAAFVVAAVELVRIALVTPVALQPDRFSAETLAAFHGMSLVLGAVIAFPLALGQGALSVIVRREGFPTWFASLGWVVAAGWLVTGVRTVSVEHALWVSGTAATFAWGVWVLALCVMLWRAARGGAVDGAAARPHLGSDPLLRHP